MEYFTKTSSHPLAVKYNELVAQHKALAAELASVDRQLREEGDKVQSTLPRAYTATASVNDLRDAREHPDREILRINLTATPETVAAHSEHLKRYGSARPLDEHVHSVGYFRFKDTLHHCGGGHHILPTPLEVDDALWARLKAGDIPKDLLTPNFGGTRPYPKW